MMKKMSRVLFLSVAALGLGACGPQSEGTDSTAANSGSGKDYDLLVWEDQAKSAGILEAIKQFEEEHDVTIKVVEKAYGGQIEDLRLDGPAGTGADVITIPGDQIGTAVTEGLLKELTVDQTLQDLYTESAMQSQIVDGKVYGLPKAVETQILYYNKELISEEDLPQTTDEWLEYKRNHNIAADRKCYHTGKHCHSHKCNCKTSGENNSNIKFLINQINHTSQNQSHCQSSQYLRYIILTEHS